MGVDWVPARPRTGVDAAALREIASAQARLARARGLTPPLLDPPGNEEEISGAQEAWEEIDKRLLAQLVMVTDQEDRWVSFRVGVVGYSELLPPAWCDRAWATLLPPEAADATARWQWWYEEIVAGRMSHYVRRLRTWHAARALADKQAELRALAQQVLSRSNSWANTGKVRPALENVLQLPPPPAVAPPGQPPASDGDDRADPSEDQHSTAVVNHTELLQLASGAFNRAVPGRFKSLAQIPEPPSGDPVRDTHLEQFFAWVSPHIASGCGLYMWA